MIYLPDINFWVALNFSGHTHSPSAKLWFDALQEVDRCDFCRYTQMGFLRLSSNSKVNPLQTQTMIGAWGVYDSLQLDPRVGYAEEPDNLESQWRAFTQGKTFSTHVWNDAYLAAFAMTAGYEVVTFDQGFTQYPGCRSMILQ